METSYTVNAKKLLSRELVNLATAAQNLRDACKNEGLTSGYINKIADEIDNTCVNIIIAMPFITEECDKCKL